MILTLRVHWFSQKGEMKKAEHDVFGVREPNPGVRLQNQQNLNQLE